MGEGQVSSDGTVTRLERYCQCRIGRLAINRRWLEGWDARRLDRREEALLGRLSDDTKATKVPCVVGINQMSLRPRRHGRPSSSLRPELI